MVLRILAIWWTPFYTAKKVSKNSKIPHIVNMTLTKMNNSNNNDDDDDDDDAIHCLCSQERPSK